MLLIPKTEDVKSSQISRWAPKISEASLLSDNMQNGHNLLFCSWDILLKKMPMVPLFA